MEKNQHEQHEGNILSCFRQTMRIMRLSVFFMVVGTAIVWSATTYSQSTKLSVNLEDATVRDVIEAIEEQSEFLFLFQEGQVDLNRRVSIRAEGKQLQEILDEVFRGTDNIYIVSDRQVVIGKAPRKTLEAQLTVLQKDLKTVIEQPQQKEITGKVTDSSGEPLPGATVMVKGTTIGTVTDANGNFSLRIPANAQTLQISFVGMKTVEMPIGNRITFNVVLEEEAIGLQEVVAIGYGTMRKINLTGAVDQVSNEVFENRPMPNLIQGLQGVMPNVNIRMLDGKPTESPKINIRGTTSIGQGGQALVLIDGVEGDPSMLNPNDIETISVLKDASSCAIYGARGSFGVVLITTKKPQEGNFFITFSTNQSIKKPTFPPNYVTDGYTFASMFNESFYNWEGTYPQNVNKTLTFSQEYLSELKRRSENPDLPRIEIGQDGQYVYYCSTDWYDLLYKDYQYSPEYNISMSGSTNRTSFMISGRYLGQEGLFRYNSDDYQIYNLRAKGTVDLFPWLRVGNNFEYSQRTYFNPLNVGEGSGIWRNIADEGHPLAPMLNPDGTLTHSAAYTVGDFYYGKNGYDFERRNLRNTIDAVASFNTFKIMADFSFQNRFDKEGRKRVPVPYSKAPGVIETVGSQYNDLRITQDQINYIASNLYAEYENRFENNHYIKVMAGTNYEQSTYQRLRAERNGLIFEDAQDISLALGQSIETSGGYEKWRILGGFYRLNYIYKDKYLIELNGRYDGSSKFPENQRYAFFPSISAGWRISEESFWLIPENIISDLKIRASYGSLGNGNIASYSFLETFTISQSDRILNGVQPKYTSRPSVLPTGLTWETATTQNIGFDLGMVSGKLQLGCDIYSRKTMDMYTIGMTLPATFGATSPKGNYADLKTNGWELILSWRDKVNFFNKLFNYNIKLSLSDYKAKILKYNNPDKFLTDYYEGMTIGEIWGYITEGFFISQEEIDNHADQSRFKSTSWGGIYPGDIKLKDINEDGKIDPGANTVNDPGDRIIIGNSSPRYSFGININADWNNIFFSSFFQGVGKQDWYPSSESTAFWGQYNRPYNDIPKWHLKNGIIWSEDNPDSFFPRYVSRLANRTGAILTEKQTGYVMNAAYIRLKNLQVGYNFPQNMISKTRIRSAKLYISGENIWTWSPLYRKVDNIDVENVTAPSDQLFTSSNAGDGYNYPMLKSISLGLSLTF